MPPVNLKLLAKKLNISVSTVSKAFRNSYDISAETREKVLVLAKELNYQPNPIASSLRTHKSKTIAVIIPEIANNFFTLAINGIESIAREENYHVLIYLTHEDYNKEIAFTQLVQNGRVDGILVSLSQTKGGFSHLDQLKDKDIPVVFFDRVYENANNSMVITNDSESSYLATKHLIERGCKRIAHLSFPGNLSIGDKRKEGYHNALRDEGLSIDTKLLVYSTNNAAEDYQQIKKLLKQKPRPDGIFSAFEKMALLSYEVCMELKLKIPDDIKIISFSNLETASLLNPSLTTITQPAFEMGKAAASLLFKALKKNPD